METKYLLVFTAEAEVIKAADIREDTEGEPNDSRDQYDEPSECMVGHPQ